MTSEQDFVLEDLLQQLADGSVINPGADLREGIWFLATPYSQEPSATMAASLAAQQAAFLVAAGIAVFAPIVHGHQIYLASRNPALGQPLPTDAGFWNRMNADIFRACAGLIVCRFGTWRSSLGVRTEILAAARIGKTIVPMTPGVLP